MNRTLLLIRQVLFIATVLIIYSCATLSREQVQSIDKFVTACDSFYRYPSFLFTELAQLRLERGFFYAASLEDPQNQINELNAIHKSYKNDLRVAAKCDASLKILKSYSNALKVLTSGERWKSRGVIFRSLGRSMDSLIVSTNRLKIFESDLPVGIAKNTAKIVAYGAESMLRHKQHRLARTFVSEADTLVQAVISSLVSSIRSPHISALIENEKRSLPVNYKNFLTSHSNAPANSLDNHRKYLQLKERCDKLNYSKGYITLAAKRLARTHTELAKSMNNNKKLGELIEQLTHLVEDIKMLQAIIEN